MASELVRWDSYDPVPATRATRKVQARIKQESLQRRAADEAAVSDAEFRIVRERELARLGALLRDRAAHDVLDYGYGRAEQRSTANAGSSRGNAQLAQILQEHNEIGARIDQIIAFDLGTRR